MSAETGPIRVTIAGDAMQASLTILASAPDDAPTADACLAALRGREVFIDGRVEKAVRALVDAHTADPSVDHEGVVATGVAPEHGEDGRFELDPALAEAPAPPADPDDQVDFYDAASFTVVRAGRTLGRIIPPTPGADGRTVQGASIAARSGKSCALKTDATVTIRDESVIAAVDGALQLDDEAVRVRQTLEIEGSVDYATGNIRFPGDVIVRECVRDCFLIESDRDVVVRGVVEAAAITAGRDAHLLGGMAGREKGALMVGRDLTARYLGMVAGVVGRDATIEREIIDSDLEVRGAFTGERCALVGGRLAVSGAATVGEVGRDAGARTEVILGRAPRVDHLAAQARSLLARLEVERKEDHEESPSAGAQAMRRRLGDAVERLRERMAPASSVQLTVLRRVHPGVVVIVGAYELAFTAGVQGPVRITLDLGGRPRVVQVAGGQPLEIESFARLRTLRSPAEERSDAA